MPTRMKTRTQGTPAAMATPWPAHAMISGRDQRVAIAEDFYAAVIKSGTLVPEDLHKLVQALDHAATWQVDLQTEADTLGTSWTRTAMDAAIACESIPDLGPLLRRQAILGVRADVTQRLHRVIELLTAQIVTYLRHHEETIVSDYLRPAFDALIAQAAPVAQQIPATVTDDGSALTSGVGVAWLQLTEQQTAYGNLCEARRTLNGVCLSWPTSDPGLFVMLGRNFTERTMRQEPRHPVARFAWRVRNADTLGLWMPTSSDAASLIEARA